MIKDYGKSPDEVKKLDTEKWTTAEVRKLFIIHSFSAPIAFCTRIKDGVDGTIEFGHSPRFYFNFREKN